MDRPALPWLMRLCQLFEKHEPSVYGCIAEDHNDGVLVTFELDRGSTSILLMRKGVSSSYASSASVDIAIHQPPEGEPSPGNSEFVARRFIEILQRADKGNLDIGSRHRRDATGATQAVTAEPDEASAAREAMQEEIHRAEFIAYMNESHGPLQAFVEHPTDDQTAVFDYLRVALKSGFDRQEVKTRFGVEIEEVASAPFSKLLALGLVKIDRTRVDPLFRSEAEWLVFRCFFLTLPQLEAAHAAWGDQYDPNTDYASALAQLCAPG